MTQDVDVAIVGAGVSGLTAGFWLTRAGRRVVVFEAAPRVGGALETFHEAEWLFEHGPNTVLETPAVEELIRDADFEAERLAASVAGKNRYLYKEGRLLPLPTGPSAVLTSRLLPFASKLRLLREPFVGRRKDEQEESVADFVRRRLGTAVLDYAVGPFVSGIWAGDPEKLSIRWAFPRLAELEQHHGSLFRGMIEARRQRGDSKRRGPMISFRGGFVHLARHLADRIGDVRTEHAVRSLQVEGSGDARRFRIRTEPSTDVTARRVILTPSATLVADILAEVTEGESRLLSKMPYAPVAVISLGYRRDDVPHPLDGFGFLAPRVEDLRILGCLFPSSLFPGRAPDGGVALTVFLGGRSDPEALELEDDQMLAVVRTDLEKALGIPASTSPLTRHVRRWPRAIPQYEIGHGRFVERARKIRRDVPGLGFAVNWLDGTAVPECIEHAKQAACEILSP